jgi:hypothetical protein
MAYPFRLAQAGSRLRRMAKQKNLLKNRVLDPPSRGDVKRLLAHPRRPRPAVPVDNLVEGE